MMGFELRQSQRTDDWHWNTSAEHDRRHRITSDSAEGYRRKVDAIHGAELTLAELLRADELDVERIVDEFLASRGEFAVGAVAGQHVQPDGTVVDDDGHPILITD